MNAFCRAYSESESVSLSLFFVPAFVFVTFLCQIRMFPDWCFPQTLSQLPLPSFLICPLFLSVSLVFILYLYHVCRCRCFLVSPEGREACFCVAVFVFFLMCLCLFLLLSLALFAVSVFVIIFDVKWECSQTEPPPRGSRSLAPSAPFLLNIQINFLLSLLFLVKIFLSIFY